MTAPSGEGNTEGAQRRLLSVGHKGNALCCYVFLLLGLTTTIFGCANPTHRTELPNSVLAVASSSEGASDRDEQIGRYTADTKGQQQLLYRVLGYCSDEFPAKRELMLRAKDEWDKRNLPIINSWHKVIQNWLATDGIASKDIPSLLEILEIDVSAGLEALKPIQEEAVKVIAIKPLDERMKTCTMFAGFVIGSGRDIRLTSPAAVKIYEKFAPASPNSQLQGAPVTYKQESEDISGLIEQARNGSATAQYELGNRYYMAQGVEQSYILAAEMYRKAADQGNAEAQYWLGNMYESGRGVENSQQLAFFWFLKAAENGNKTAGVHVAARYALGKGVTKDYEKSFYWTNKLAEGGSPGDQKLLGLIYENGKGVKQDYGQAIYWYTRAAEQKEDVWEAQSAQGYLDELQRRLSLKK